MTTASTTTVDRATSARLGQLTRRNSPATSLKNCWIRFRNSIALTAAAKVRAADHLAGVEGFEPPSPGFGVRCSSRSSYTPVPVGGSLDSRSEATPVNRIARAAPALERVERDAALSSPGGYFDSLWSVCLRQNLQNFFTPRRSGCVRLFLVVE